MTTVYFRQEGAKTADGFLTTDEDPPKAIFGRRNLPTNEGLAPGDYVFTCEPTDTIGTKVTVIVSTDASVLATSSGTIDGDVPGEVATGSIDVPFTVPGELLAQKVLMRKKLAAKKRRTKRPSSSKASRKKISSKIDKPSKKRS